MPYLNEHSARLRDPKDFNPDSFRRKNDGTIYGKIKVPKTIAVIWAKLKGKDKPADSPIPQALRFSTKSWTVEKAKAWLKNNKIKYRNFEPAAPKKQEQQAALANDPKKNPFVFNMQGPVEFAEPKQDGEKNNIRLHLYDGSIVKHWYWGNLAFELTTMKMAKKGKNAILFGHDTDQRIAYSTKATFESEFILEGPFLKTSEKAQEVKGQIEEGFPFEASFRFNPDKSNILHIGEGQSVDVNGYKLKGPGTIVKNALIVEGSICVFGALKNTVSEAFEIENENAKFKEHIMDNETQEMTIDSFAADYPELNAEIRRKAKADGEKAERDRFASFCERFGEDPAFCMKIYNEGKTLDDAIIAFAQKCKTERDAALEEAKKASTEKQGAAEQEFSDEQDPAELDTATKTKDGKPADFMAAVKQQMEKANCSEADAVRFCAVKYPKLHQQLRQPDKQE